MLTVRQIRILEVLYEQNDFITIMDIAETIGVSKKTIRNDLASIKIFCQEHKTGKVEAKPHEGVKAKLTKEEWERFICIHQDSEMRDGKEIDFKFTAIRLLLKKKTVSFKELEKNLYSGRGMIEKELSDIKKWFQNQNILFEIGNCETSSQS